MTTHRLRSHWFFWAAPLDFAVDAGVSFFARGQMDRLLEAGLLFDLAVLVPALYWLAYRQRQQRIGARVLALACVGIWLALQLVPEAERDLLNHVEPLRYAGIAVLVALELAVMAAIYRAIFKGGTVEDAVAQAPSDLPAWVARLIAWEARLWQRAWSALRRFTRRR